MSSENVKKRSFKMYNYGKELNFDIIEDISATTVTTIECADIKIAPMSFRFLILIETFSFCQFYKVL